MFFENEPTRTLTLIEFLLVMLIGLVPVAINIWMKPLLSRRRVAEDERDSLTRADHESRDAAGSAGFSEDSVAPFFQVREPRILRKLPATFDRNKPLAPFVVNPATEDPSPKAKRRKSDHLLSANNLNGDGALKAKGFKRTRQRAFDRGRDRSDLQGPGRAAMFPV